MDISILDFTGNNQQTAEKSYNSMIMSTPLYKRKTNQKHLTQKTTFRGLHNLKMRLLGRTRKVYYSRVVPGFGNRERH